MSASRTLGYNQSLLNILSMVVKAASSLPTRIKKQSDPRCDCRLAYTAKSVLDHIFKKSDLRSEEHSTVR